MARPKEFQKDEALIQAMKTFWRSGYTATSMQDLTEGMGINRQSLYDTFGGKKELFLAVLDRYIRHEGSDWIRPLFQEDDFRRGLRLSLERLADETVADPQGMGCLVVNSAVECANADEEILEKLNTAMCDTEKIFFRRLNLAKECGDLSKDLDAQATARFLMNSVRGLRVLARAQPNREAMQSIIDLTMKVIQ